MIFFFICLNSNLFFDICNGNKNIISNVNFISVKKIQINSRLNPQNYQKIFFEVSTSCRVQTFADHVITG